MERYAEERAAAVRRELDDPLEQLRLAIQLGVPTGPDDEESRLLYELDAFTGTSPAFAVLSRGLLRPPGLALRVDPRDGAGRRRLPARMAAPAILRGR